MFETNKKKSYHQNQVWGTKSKNYQLKIAYIFIQHEFKISFLNLFYAWTDLTN